MVAPVAHLAPSHGGSACSSAKHHNRGGCQYSCLPPTYPLISTNWLIWLTSTIIMLTKVCAVSENWVDGPGTEEQVLLELKIGHKVMSPKYCPQSYCARDFSIKGKLWKHFLGLFHPPTQRHLGSIGRTQVGWKYCLDLFLQSLPLIGLRVDRLDSAAACWRLRKQILFSFEFGKRQTTGLDFDFYSKKDGSSNSCFQTPKGDQTRKWWRRPLSKASYFCIWGITLIFLDYPHCAFTFNRKLN